MVVCQPERRQHQPAAGWRHPSGLLYPRHQVIGVVATGLRLLAFFSRLPVVAVLVTLLFFSASGCCCTSDAVCLVLPLSQVWRVLDLVFGLKDEEVKRLDCVDHTASSQAPSSP